MGGRRRTLAREMKPVYNRTHAKRCKMVVSDANTLGNMKLCILTSKNQIYSRCSFITETEFTIIMLGLPNALFGLHQNLKYNILTRTAQQCGSHGGQRLTVFCLRYSLINFRKLYFSVKNYSLK